MACGTFSAMAATNSMCASRTGLVDFGGRSRDISSRLAVVIHLAWAMGYSVAWVRAGGEVAACRRPAFFVHEKSCRSKEKVYTKKGGGLPGVDTARRFQCGFLPR